MKVGLEEGYKVGMLEGDNVVTNGVGTVVGLSVPAVCPRRRFPISVASPFSIIIPRTCQLLAFKLDEVILPTKLHAALTRVCCSDVIIDDTLTAKIEYKDANICPFDIHDAIESTYSHV